MLCYQIEGTPNYLLISWKVPLFRKNEFCVHVCADRLLGEQKEKMNFRKNVHKPHKKLPDESIQIDYDDFRASATMSSG